MRQWNVVGKYPIYNDNNEISHTEIAIASTSAGYATFSERILGNHLNKSEKELIDLALESFFKSEFSDRAMAESVQKIDEMENTIKEGVELRNEMQKQLDFAEEKISKIDEALEKSANQYERIENQSLEWQEQSQTAQVTLMTVIFKLYEKGLLTDEDLAETTTII